MESTRRLVIAATLGVAVIALTAISDFLFGSFWSPHAMFTSLIASLLVLAVTVVVLPVPLAWWAERTQSFVSELSTPGG
jgi:hypothetical protein